MIKKLAVLSVLVAVASLLLLHTSCKGCKKEEKPVTTDSVSARPSTAPINNINLPHADTSLIPILSQILDETFEASAKKDYSKLATSFVLVTPDGFVPYTTKDKELKKLISITSEVLNKWNRGVEKREYLRVFELTQPNGMSLPVMEVIFASKKSFYRKFFVFAPLENGEYKVLDIVSNL